MTTPEFDPDIPVGEPAGHQPSDHFSTGPASNAAPPTPANFTPDGPMYQPGGFQPAAHFNAAPAPTQSGEFNPAAASAGQRPKENFGPEPASLGIRAAARAIDGVLCAILAAISTPVLPETSPSLAGADPDAAAAAVGLVHLMNVVLQSMTLGVVSFLFFMIFESVVGWTPGKKLLGLSVHASSRPGAPRPSLGQAANRNRFLLLLAIPIPYLSYLFFIFSSTRIALSIFNSKNRRGKHDIRAGTEVTKG